MPDALTQASMQVSGIADTPSAHLQHSKLCGWHSFCLRLFPGPHASCIGAGLGVIQAELLCLMG